MNSVGKMASRVGLAFGALAAATAIGPILRASDAYTVVTNRLKLVTASQEDLAAAYKAVYKLAQETRAPLEATGKFYAQLSLNAKQLKLSQEDLITVTGTLNKIIALTGQSAEASSNAIIQLQQALGSGQLRGDELRSIMEQLPLLGQIIADSMGIAYGQLKDAGADGLITAKIVTQALKASAEDIDKAFKNMSFTFGQAFIMLYNGFVNAIGQINEATGLFSALAKGIAYVGYYMTEVIATFGVFAAAIVALKAAGFVAWLASSTFVATTFASGMATGGIVVSNFTAYLWRAVAGLGAMRTAMIAFMLSNPFTALLTGLVLILPLLYQFRDSIVLSSDGTITLGTVFASVFTSIKEYLPVVILAMKSLWQTVLDIVAAVGTAFIPIWKAAQAVFDALWPSIEAIINAFGGVATKVGAVTLAFGLMIATFNPWIAAGLIVIGVLNQFDPGLKKTTFALTLMGEAIGVLIKLALVPLVVGFQAIVNIMGGFGLVSLEVVQSVNQQADAFIKNAGSLDGMTERVQVAYDEMIKVDDATTQSKDSATAWGIVLEGKLNPALVKSAEQSTKTAKSAGELATGVTNINRSLDATPAKAAKVDNSFAASVIAANANTVAINALAQAYRNLHAAQAGKSSGSASISGSMTKPKGMYRGGPVSANTPYLVGEQGPELFVPNSSGSIVNNAALTGSSGFSQQNTANDNNPIRYSVSPETKAVVKQITRMADAVVMSNEVVIDTATKWNMVDYKDSKYAPQDGYKVGTKEDRWANYGGSKTTNGLTTGGGNYIRPDGTKPLPGDADYVGNYQQWGGIKGNPTGMIGGAIVSGVVDLNDPTAAIRQSAQMAAAMGDKAGAARADAQADKIIEELKRVRDNTANFKEFLRTYQSELGTPTTIDFQTLFPTGPMTYRDPYNLGSGSSPSANTVMPQQSPKKSNDKGEGSDKPMQVNMVVMTPNAESFRQNRAQVEGGLYSMVRRAQKRANG